MAMSHADNAVEEDNGERGKACGKGRKCEQIVHGAIKLNTWA